MPFKTPNKTSEYLRSLHAETDPLLQDLTAYADEHFIPVLLPESAAVLAQLIRLKKPQKILEIGTAIGYSSLVMLKNCEARLYTVEVLEERVEKAKFYFEKAGVMDRVTCFVGDAGEIVPMLNGTYDFIFMDGPKTRYPEYLPYLKRLLSKCGVLVCDNVLFNGMSSGDGEWVEKKASIARRIDEFLRELYDEPEYLTSVLPVGDGMSVSLRSEKI